MPKIVKRPTSCQAPIAARLGASADRAYRAGQPRRPKTLQYWLRNGPAMGAGPSICQSPPLLGVGDRRSGAGSEALLFEVGGLTTEVQNAALHLLQCVFSEFSMNVVVDLILNEYQSIRPLDAERLADSRLKIGKYLEVLRTAGQSDTKRLSMYGLAYLKEMHEGRDPRFTGC